jgi:surface polysaccharide O-acyltransferase-like enzyme
MDCIGAQFILSTWDTGSYRGRNEWLDKLEVCALFMVVLLCRILKMMTLLFAHDASDFQCLNDIL